MSRSSSFGVIAVGELLVDMIGCEYTDAVAAAGKYQCVTGGSPANLAGNLARLGVATALVATVGDDPLGHLLIEGVQKAGVDCRAVYKVDAPTTLILVTKSKMVSDFIAYRTADRLISAPQLEIINQEPAKILHTTAFALSEEPARSSILDALIRGADAGAKLSVDFNYADKLWGSDRAAGQRVLATLCKAGAMVKMSEVDYERLFAEPPSDVGSASRRIQALGASLVCLTLGPDGCHVTFGETSFSLPANRVEVVDTTGAGDAFWAGFLAAHLDGFSWLECARAGRGLAERKLTRLGPVLDRLSVKDLLSN